MTEVETTHVVIVGCGPTGALLSALLTKYGIPHIVLERSPTIVTDPRGIALDEDGIRILQSIGLYDKVFSEIGQSIGWLFFTSGQRGLDTTPFMKVNLGTSDGHTGHVGAICHQQPVLEKWVRSKAGGDEGEGGLRLGVEVVGIQEVDHGEAVQVEYTDGNEMRKVKGKFLVAADGKTGFTRKRFLEPKGVVMESKPGYEYKETWVAVNYHITPPTPSTHPDFPLWQSGYTPDEVYDSFFPRNFRFIGNPDRPAVCGTFGRREDRLWRFEFVVQGDEDGTDMATYEKSTAVIFPYLTHEGSRYGLPGHVQFPPDCINVLRSRPFTFSARSCNKWVLDRVILCGDAAHVMPPFGGQGIASGFRDAFGLAWRLAYHYRLSVPTHHAGLLHGWFLERKQQLDSSIAATVTNGSLCTTRDPVKRFFRDWIFWFMQQVPPLNRWLERGNRNEGTPRYKWENNMAFLPGQNGGICFPQVFCQSLQPRTVEKNQVRFTDDVIFSDRKRGLFQLVVLVDSVGEATSAVNTLRNLNLQQHSEGLLDEEEATYIIHDTTLRPKDLNNELSTVSDCIYRISSRDEFANSELCRGRPVPQGYDMYRLKKDVCGHRFIVLRPDRFVFAACDTGDEMVDVVTNLEKVLQGSKL